MNQETLISHKKHCSFVIIQNAQIIYLIIFLLVTLIHRFHETSFKKLNKTISNIWPEKPTKSSI